MNPNRPSFLDIANFAGSEGLDTGRVVDAPSPLVTPNQTTPNPIEQKKQNLSQSSAGKKALWGSDQEQRVLATSVLQDNDLTRNQMMEDIQRLDPVEWGLKYGFGTSTDRADFFREIQRVETLKERERTGAEVAQDSAIDVGKMLVNTVGNAGALGAAGVDQVLGTNISPTLSQGLESFNEFANSNQSELMQDRRAQHQLEAELDRQDRENQFQKDQAKNPDSVLPNLKKQGQAFLDTVKNFADDPIMAGSLVPEGIGSLIPSTAAIKVAGKARAISKAMKQGRTRKEAEDFLKTGEGRKLLDEESVKVAPAVLAASEGGAGVTQTQQEILGMDEEELAQNETYQALLDQGFSPEDARMAFARNAGLEAGLLSLPGALAAGRVAAPFAAKPLSTGARGGFGSSVVGAARNVASEGVEEALQEANTQAASNVALGRDITEGLGEAAGAGALGGIATAGALQAPGAAAGTLAETGRALASGATAAADARETSIQNRINKTGASGSDAREAVSTKAIASTEALKSSLVSDQTTPNQTEGNEIAESDVVAETPTAPRERIDLRETKGEPVEVEKVAQVFDAANYMTQEEVNLYSGMFPDLASTADEGGRVKRRDFMEAAGSLMQSEDPNQAVQGALGVLDIVNELRKADSTTVNKSLENLPEDHPARLAKADLQESIQVVSSSKTVEDAKAIIAALTPDAAKAVVSLEKINDPNTSEEEKATFRSMARVVAETNPEAIDGAGYDAVLNQKGTSGAQKRVFQAAKKAVQLFSTARQEKSKINYSKRPTVDVVRDEIEVDGNSSNDMPSLTQHYSRIMDAVRTGKTEDGTIYLQGLRSFAESQINKINAYNESLKKGGENVPFEAYGPNGFFTQEEFPAFTDLRNVNSVSLAHEAQIDTQSVVGLYNLMRAAYGDELGFGGAPLKAPLLDRKIRAAAKRYQQEGSSANRQPDAPRTSEETRRASRPERRIRKGTNPATGPVVVENDDEVAESLNEDTPPQTTPTEESSDVEAQANQEREAGTGNETEAGSNSETDEQGNEAGSQDTDETGQGNGGSNGARVTDAESEVVQQEEDVDQSEQETGETQEEQIESDLEEPSPTNQGATRTWFTNLKSLLLSTTGSFNRFLQGFRPSRSGSSLVQHASPSEFIKDNIDNLMTDGNGLTQDLTTLQKRGVLYALNNIVPGMVSGFTDRMMNAATEGKWFENLEQGKDVLGYQNGLPMNFLEVTGKDENEEDTYALNDQVMQAAMMAGIEWVAEQQSTGKPYLDDEKVNKRLGFDRDGFVTPDMREAANSGVMMQNALTTMARKMEVLLGVEGDPKASTTMTQGLFKAMASNVLDELNNKQLVKINKFEKVGGSDKTIQSVSLPYSPAEPRTNGQKALAALESLPDVFTRTFTKGSDQVRYIGNAPTDVSPNIIRNSMAPLSKIERDVIKDRQKAPYTINEALLSLVDVIGEGVLSELLGFRDPEKAKFNENDLESVKGKNASIQNGFRGFRGYLNQAQEYAESKGLPLAQVPIFFDWKISSVGRLQQQGPVTPQGDKIMRELVTITNATVDISDPASEQTGDLWLAVAQSLDISIDKEKREDAIEEAKGLVGPGGVLQPAMMILKEWNQSGEMSPKRQKRFAESLRASDRDFTMKTLHALLTVAQMEAAREVGGKALSEFKTSLSMEADGVTDGPINALVHMYTGKINSWYLKTLAKGGWFFDGVTRTRNEQWAKDNRDLYEEAAGLFNERLGKYITSLKKENQDNAHRVYRTLDALVKGFSIENWNEKSKAFEIDRKVVKNPLTVMIYGSGKKGVAGKIANEMVGVLYGALSEMVQSGQKWQDHKLFKDNPQLADDLSELFNSFYDPKSKSNQDKSGVDVVKDFLENPEKGGVNKDAFDNLVSHVQVHFASTMFDALDEATGGLTSNMQLAQKASQIQAKVFKDLLLTRIEERRMELAKAGKIRSRKKKDGSIAPTDMLSEEDMRQVFMEVSSSAPIYETEAHEFHIASKEGFDSQKIVSQNFEGKNQGNLVQPTPSEASVKVSPYMTIGTGDGRMILNIYAEDDGTVSASLPVFDGVEIGVDNIRAASEHINKQVFNGWMQDNAFDSMSKGYRQMLSSLDLNKLDSKTIEEIEGILALEEGQTIEGELDRVSEQLERKADIIKARKEAMASVPSRVDHMAGAGASYENKGSAEASDASETAEAVTNLDDVADLISTRAREAYDRIQAGKKTKTERPTTQKPSAHAQTVVDEMATPIEGYGSVKSLPGNSLIHMVTDDKDASPEQVELMKLIGQGGTMRGLDGFTVYTGTAVDLNRFKDQQFPHLAGEEIQEGQTLVGSNLIFLTNVSAETVLHEAIHAATFRALVDAYETPDNASPSVREAVQRLEALKGEFLKIKPETQKPNVREAMETLRGELEDPNSTDAKKMAEFLAWSLSNQNLIDLGQQTRVRNPLAQVVFKAMQALRRILGLKTEQGKNLFENVRFNAEILGVMSNRTTAERQSIETDLVLNQVYPGSERLKTIETRFLTRLNSYLEASRPKDDQNQKAQFDKEIEIRRQQARTASETAIANGYGLNPRQGQAYEAMHLALMSGMRLDPSLMRQATQAYRHVISKISVDDFLDQETPSAEDRKLAEKKIAFLTGADGIRKTTKGNSDLLASFLALAQVDDSLRGVLEDMPAPKALQVKYDSVDGFLRSIANGIIELITRLSLSRGSQSGTVIRELDRLSTGLSEVEGDRRFLASMEILSRPSNMANEYAAKALDKGTKAATNFLRNKSKNAKNDNVKLGLVITRFLLSVGSKDEADNAGDTLTKMANDMPNMHALRELLSDIRGGTKSNLPLLKLINLVRSTIDAVRQDYRETIPEELAKRFNRKLKKQEWTQLFMGLARTDLMTFGRGDAIKFLRSPQAVNQKIKDLEEKVLSGGGRFGNLYLEKANALATYMMSREVTSNSLQRNAKAIAYLYGEQGNRKKLIEKQVTPDLIEAIDQLTSLYAFQQLDKETVDNMTELMNQEETGMRAVIGTLQAARSKELSRGGSNVAQNNAWKGYVPSLVAQGSSVIIEDDANEGELLRKGYVRIGTYRGSGKDGFVGQRGYYQSTVGGKNAFRQGIAQTVHTSFQGVDDRNGITMSPETQGQVRGERAQAIARNIEANGSNNNLRPGEYLLPIFGDAGNVVGYELSLDPNMMTGLQRDTHLGRMLGVWMGRIEEEGLSHDANRALLQTLKESYDNMSPNERRDFVNVADPKSKDPVIRDAWDTLGWQIKEDAAKIFGKKDFLPIRKDMINDAIGYRAASVTDAWSGISRLSKENQDRVKRAATTIIGVNAFKRLKQGEQLVGDVVSYAKTTIIVRSIQVAWENLLSNQLHLLAWGINPVKALTATREKFIEITQYVKNLEQLQSLRTDLTAAFDDPRREAKIKAQIQALEDVNDRLSIAPLLKAGEFSTISENLTEADVAIREGRWGDFMEKATDKLPGWGGTVAKNVLITKDTALFQGLNRMVQYGDFVAKAVLYDHLTEKLGQSQEQALETILEEFVQYNRLPGRSRDFLESNGLLWFFSYKLRIMKIAAKMLRERPVSSLFMMGGMAPSLGIDSVASGSIAGTIWDGSAGYAIGPEMGIKSPTLHPVWELLN